MTGKTYRVAGGNATKITNLVACVKQSGELENKLCAPVGRS